MSFPRPSTSLFWSRDWHGAVRRMKDQRGQAEALGVLTGQHQGPQDLSGRKEKVWGKPGEKGPRPQWVFRALFVGRSPKVAAREAALGRTPCGLNSPSAQPGFPSGREVGKDHQYTGSDWQLYAAPRCGGCELSPGQSPSRTRCPDGERSPVPSKTEGPTPP